MPGDEVSIRRCTWLLNQRKFKYWREAEIGTVVAPQGTNRDFLVETSAGVRFFLELKSFEKDTILDKIDRHIRVFSIGHMSLQKRVNRLVRDAAEQLQPYAGTLPMVVGLDNYLQKGVSLDRDSLGSLFGELGVQFKVAATTGRAVEETWVRKDDSSPLANGRSRHASAVLAILPVKRFDTVGGYVDDFSVERVMKVRIMFNENAAVPLPREVFSAPEDEHLN